MSRESVLVLAGALVLLGEFIGLPLSWLSILFPLLGVIIIGIGVSLGRERKRVRSLVHETSPQDSA